MAISARTSTMSLGAIACVVRVVVNQVDAITIHRVIVRRGRRAARAQTAPYRPIPTLRLARVCPPQFPVPSAPPPPSRAHPRTRTLSCSRPLPGSSRAHPTHPPRPCGTVHCLSPSARVCASIRNPAPPPSTSANARGDGDLYSRGIG
jgi:hypothetical protein